MRSRAWGDPRAAQYYTKAVEIWERMDKSYTTIAGEANAYAAISNAYLALNQAEKAVVTLEHALVAAQGLGPGQVFSAVQYRLVPQQIFVSEIRQALEGARRRAAEHTTERQSKKLRESLEQEDKSSNSTN